MGVAIDAASAILETVIEVKGPNLIDPHYPIKLPHRGTVIRGSHEGVAGGEDVARIETNAQPAIVPYARKNLGQMLEPPAKRRALAGRGFQQDAGGNTVGLSERFIQSGDNASQPFRLARGGIGPRMGNHPGNPRVTARCTSSIKASIDFFQRTFSGLPRLIK